MANELIFPQTNDVELLILQQTFQSNKTTQSIFKLTQKTTAIIYLYSPRECEVLQFFKLFLKEGRFPLCRHCLVDWIGFSHRQMGVLLLCFVQRPAEWQQTFLSKCIFGWFANDGA